MNLLQGKGRLKVGLCPACSVETSKAEKVERRVPYSPENDYELDQEPVFDDAPLSEMKKFRVKKEAPRVKKEAIDDFESGVKQESSKPKGPPRKHPCDKCPYVAVSLTSLYNHVKIVHDNIREHICSECGFKSGTSHGLMAHTKSVHLKIREVVITSSPVMLNLISMPLDGNESSRNTSAWPKYISMMAKDDLLGKRALSVAENPKEFPFD